MFQPGDPPCCFLFSPLCSVSAVENKILSAEKCVVEWEGGREGEKKGRRESSRGQQAEPDYSRRAFVMKCLHKASNESFRWTKLLKKQAIKRNFCTCGAQKIIFPLSAIKKSRFHVTQRQLKMGLALTQLRHGDVLENTWGLDSAQPIWRL